MRHAVMTFLVAAALCAAGCDDSGGAPVGGGLDTVSRADVGGGVDVSGTTPDVTTAPDAELPDADPVPADVAGRPDVLADVLPDIPPDTVEPVGTDTVGDSAVNDISEPSACALLPADLAGLVAEDYGRYHFVPAFSGPGLVDRPVTIFLPADYGQSGDQRYPVFYMHDGQNLFDGADSAFGVEWQVDEAVDALVAAGEIPPLIVVGVWNTADRLEEYRSGPDPTADDGEKAAAYRALLAERIKPWVDANYRTKCDRANTALAGSSMGGVASLAHALHRPHVWGRIGCVSTAFWYGEKELPGWLDANEPGQLPDRIWMDVGTAEGGSADWFTYVMDSRRVRDRLIELGCELGDDLAYFEEIDAIHNEADWARRMPAILRYLWGADPAVALPPDGIELHSLLPALTLEPATTGELVVQAQFGASVLTWPNAEVEFSAEPAGVVSVDTEGRLTPLGEGEATVTATLDGRSASAPVTVYASGAVTFEVIVPDTPAADAVFIVGDHAALGSWDPAAVPLAAQGGGVFRATLPIPPGTEVHYKYTRGSWATVEKGPNGEEIQDRVFTATPGAVVRDVVARWADSP